jgi:hypothetical protein
MKSAAPAQQQKLNIIMVGGVIYTFFLNNHATSII